MTSQSKLMDHCIVNMKDKSIIKAIVGSVMLIAGNIYHHTNSYGQVSIIDGLMDHVKFYL